MTRVANQYGAVKPFAGVPDFPMPESMKGRGNRGIRDDINQYAITWARKSS